MNVPFALPALERAHGIGWDVDESLQCRALRLDHAWHWNYDTALKSSTRVSLIASALCLRGLAIVGLDE